MIKKPFFDVAVRYSWSPNERSEIYKQVYLVTLILFIITVPFAILSSNYYCNYNKDEIRYSEYFEFNEHVVSYEDIDEVVLIIHHDNGGNVDTFKYIIVDNGKEIDVNSPNLGNKAFTEDVFYIHRRIEENGICNIKIVELTEIDEKHITENLNSRILLTCRLVKTLF